MAQTTGCGIAPALLDPAAARFWINAASEIESIANEARTAIAWRRNHPGVSAHIKMARTTAQQQATRRMERLRTLLLNEAPAHWDVSSWGFSVAANLRDLRWDQRMGKGRASWSNHVYGNRATDIAAFAGRLLAAFSIARAANRTDGPPTLFRFALPETHRKAFGSGTETTWNFRANPVAGRGADDAFAYGTFLGVFPKHHGGVSPAQTFQESYQLVVDQHATAVASRTPDLIERVLEHPKAKRLMGAQIDPNDSRDLKRVQDAIRQRQVLEADPRVDPANPRLLDRVQTVKAGRAMESFLEEVLHVLDGLGNPSVYNQHPTSWKVWSAQRKGRSTRVWAWDLASASAVAAIDDLQFIVDAQPPSHYARILKTTM